MSEFNLMDMTWVKGEGSGEPRIWVRPRVHLGTLARLTLSDLASVMAFMTPKGENAETFGIADEFLRTGRVRGVNPAYLEALEDIVEAARTAVDPNRSLLTQKQALFKLETTLRVFDSDYKAG